MMTIRLYDNEPETYNIESQTNVNKGFIRSFELNLYAERYLFQEVLRSLLEVSIISGNI